MVGGRLLSKLKIITLNLMENNNDRSIKHLIEMLRLVLKTR